MTLRRKSDDDGPEVKQQAGGHLDGVEQQQKGHAHGPQIAHKQSEQGVAVGAQRGRETQEEHARHEESKVEQEVIECLPERHGTIVTGVAFSGRHWKGLMR
ncbi:hypothetical protein GCM10008949_47110 [Deinococcus humi]|nr:hypothetical protein GCM10008949_47110 [Deinococcus humi]